jgi:hypothetical protein
MTTPLTPPVSIDPLDAVELAELLEFIDNWISYIPGVLAPSLAAFVGGDGYTIGDLRADLARFAFLLGDRDSQRRLFPHLP